MKKNGALFGWVGMGVVLLFVLSFAYPWFVQLAFAACTNTTNLSLCKPAIADSGWGTNLNSNSDKIDNAFGTGAAGHDHSGTAGEGPNTLSGKQDRNNIAVDDDSCSGEQGFWWYDTTDSQFEICNADSGVPVAIGAGDVTDVGDCTTGACLPLDGSTNDIGIQDRIVAEGVTADGFETTISFDDPTADRTFTVPNFNSSTVVTIRKTADETVNNSATLQNDDVLLLALAANETWYFTLVFSHVGNGTADIQYAFTVPAGATLKWGCIARTDTSDSFGGCTDITSSGTAEPAGAGTGNRIVLSMGVVANGGTAGNLQLQWAQNVATVVDTKVLANSYLEAHK